MSKELIKADLNKMKEEFEKMLPKHIPVDKFFRTVLTAIDNNPQLIQATRQSVVTATMRVAEDGLLPDGREAIFVTFKNNKMGTTEASYIPMVVGVLKRIRNSGEVSYISSQVVYENDDFSIWVDDTGEHVSFRPSMDDRGALVRVFAMARTTDDMTYVEVINKKEIEAVKAKSREQAKLWSEPFKLEMWRKTAIKRLSKRLPISSSVLATLEADNILYQPEVPPRIGD